MKTCNYVKNHNNSNSTLQFHSRKVGGSIICLLLLLLVYFIFFLHKPFVPPSLDDSRLFGVHAECSFRLENVSMMCCCCCCCFFSYILVIICKPSMPLLTLSFYIRGNIKSAHELERLLNETHFCIPASIYMYVSFFFAIFMNGLPFENEILRLKSGHKERKELELYHIIKWW